ncbi:MAG: ABC transporter permease [Oscillospiraceae bacterium]
MIAIYKRELRSYFSSMIGYLFIAVVTAFIGIFFMVVNLFNGYPYFSYTLGNIAFISVLTVPLLTMKTMAEERHLKTDQMLLTYPVSVTSMVIGKYLAVMTVFAIPFLLSCLCPLIIMANGVSYPASDYATIFACICLGCLYTALGLFISSLTESQIIAAVGTFGALLLLYIWPSLISFLPTNAAGNLFGLLLILTGVTALLYAMTKNKLLAIVVEAVGIVGSAALYFTAKDQLSSLLSKILGAFSCTDILENFASDKIFDLGGLFFFLSCAALFVFLTIQSVQKRHWN